MTLFNFNIILIILKIFVAQKNSVPNLRGMANLEGFYWGENFESIQQKFPVILQLSKVVSR
jgi:hypothetical protein